MTTSFRIAQNIDSDEWDSIIYQSPQSTLFHTWKWLKITEKHTRMKLYPIIGIRDGIPIGIFPLFFHKSGPLRMVFSPPPHATLFYLGPVFLGFDTLKQSKKEIVYCEFQNSVEEFIKKDLKAHYVNISLPPTLRDPRPYTWSGYTVETIYDYAIDLNQGCDHLLQTLNKRQRQNLKRAKQRGISVEIGGKDEYKLILNMMDLRYAQQGKGITTSRDYFLDIYDAFRENFKIFVAKVNGEVVSGSIDFQYKDTHYSWIGNPKPIRPLSPSPNDLLIWESVKYAQEQGFKYYITLGAALNPRLHSYYASKFNPDLRSHFSVKKCSYFVSILERGYLNIIKPAQEIMHYIQ